MATGVFQPVQPPYPFGGVIAPNSFDQTAGLLVTQSGFRTGRVAIADPAQIGPFATPGDWDQNNVILSQGNCIALFGISDYADFAADAGFFYPQGLAVSFDNDNPNVNASTLPILFGGIAKNKAVFTNYSSTPESPFFTMRGVSWQRNVRFHLPTGANAAIPVGVNGGVYGIAYVIWTEAERQTVAFQ